MYQLIDKLSAKQLWARQAPTMLGSLVIAELFYKFGSFGIECVSFLATWCALDGLVQLFGRTSQPASPVDG